jgi:hypothetical protein
MVVPSGWRSQNRRNRELLIKGTKFQINRRRCFEIYGMAGQL